VKVNEHPVAIHDHRNGICDLPKDYMAQHHANEGWVHGRCHWDGDFGHMPPSFWCNCTMCRPEPNKRKARYSARKEITQQHTEMHWASHHQD
jgi:hypothetical protein